MVIDEPMQAQIPNASPVLQDEDSAMTKDEEAISTDIIPVKCTDDHTEEPSTKKIIKLDLGDPA